jgi:drug/metabolite transporter (DMT)-like permease
LFYLVQFLLFLTPFAIFALWRQLNPEREPPRIVIWLLLAGIGLGAAGAIWYGQRVSVEAGSVYIPATVGPDGQIIPGRAERPR